MNKNEKKDKNDKKHKIKIVKKEGGEKIRGS